MVDHRITALVSCEGKRMELGKSYNYSELQRWQWQYGVLSCIGYKYSYGSLIAFTTPVSQTIPILDYWTLLLKVTNKNPKILKEIISVLMLCTPKNRRRPFSYHTYYGGVFSSFVRFLVNNWHKLRKVYWIWQVATAISINHNMGALKELNCQT